MLSETRDTVPNRCRSGMVDHLALCWWRVQGGGFQMIHGDCIVSDRPLILLTTEYLSLHSRTWDIAVLLDRILSEKNI